jgi:zinc protease
VPDKQKALARAEPARPAVYVMDKPGSIQSVVLAGHVAPPKANPDEIAIETLNTLLGGMFISRINMNLREDKHWSYGAGTVLWDARGQRPFFAYAPVQSDKTKETMAELKQELQAVVGDRPATPEELETAQNNLTLSMPGSRETTGQVAGSIVNLVQFGLPDDYYETYSGKVRKLTTRDLSDAAGKLVRPVDLVWVVVGDRSKIEAGIRDLGYGELRFIDADGKVLP